VFYSAYLPVVEDRRLPALHTAPPLLREHRLYQADWLLRYYHFSARELLTEDEPNFDPYLDPKCTWAVRHPEFFPVEVNTASRAELLRVPGIGPKSALRIVEARRVQSLGMAELKRIGVVLKRAQYFITCCELPMHTVNELTPQGVRSLLLPKPDRKKVDERQLVLNFEE
jgi:predicted DNA-binding helix-hairpin-helix protein